MSLINQMLKDLEAREDRTERDRRPEGIYQDLSSVSPPAARSKRPWFLGVFAVLVAAGAGLYLWQQGHDGTGATATLSGAASPVSEPVNAPTAQAQAVPSADNQTPTTAVANADRTEVAVASVAPTTNEPPTATSPAPRALSPVAQGRDAVSATAKSLPPSRRARKPAKRPAPRKRTAAVAPIDNTVVAKEVIPLSPQQRAETKYREAVAMMQQGRLADVEENLKAALVADAAHIKARELLAGAMLQQGHWRQAQDLLQQGIEAVPRHLPFVQLLARIQVERGHEAQALALMEQTAPAAQQDAAYLSFLATLYQRADRHADAAKAYSQALQLRPQEGSWWLGLAISLEAKQDFAAALNSYRRAIGSGALNGKPLQYAHQRLRALQDN